MPNLKLRADIFRERGYAKIFRSKKRGIAIVSFDGPVHKIDTVTRYSVDGFCFESADDGFFHELSDAIPISQKEYEKTKVLNALQ